MDQNLIVNYEEQQKQREAYLLQEKQKQGEEQRKGAWIFEKLALASLIYTIVYTICIYKNISGITVLFWIAATMGYVCYAFRVFGKERKKDSIFVMIVMVLLGISTFLTGNEWIIWMNYIAVFLLLVSLLLHNFAEDAAWDFGTYFYEIAAAVFGSVGKTAMPFIDGNAFFKSRRKSDSGKGRYIAVGVMVAIPCVLFLGVLLATADMVFANMISSIFDGLRVPKRIFGIGFMLCFGFFSSYCGVRYIAEHSENITVKDRKNGEPLIAITVTAMIAVLYLIFSVIQIAYLFIGGLQLPERITYAEYARTGFFQLLFVCILNLLLVLGIKKYFKESRLLDGMLLVISGCTFIMTASSACRMILYIQAYQLTFLRVFVLVALFTIAILMMGVVILILKPGFPFFRYGLVAVSVIYVVFSFSHIDYFIAAYNLAQVEKTGEVADYQYISCLSTDAAPVIARYVEEHPEVKTEDERIWRLNWYYNYLE